MKQPNLKEGHQQVQLLRQVCVGTPWDAYHTAFLSSKDEQLLAVPLTFESVAKSRGSRRPGGLISFTTKRSTVWSILRRTALENTQPHSESILVFPQRPSKVYSTQSTPTVPKDEGVCEEAQAARVRATDRRARQGSTANLSTVRETAIWCRRISITSSSCQQEQRWSETFPTAGAR